MFLEMNDEIAWSTFSVNQRDYYGGQWEQDHLVSFLNDRFRLGIISSGSIDAIILRYGFYGEVIRDSENYQWTDPARYGFSGTMSF